MKQRVSRNAKVISISMLLSSAIIAGGIAYASGDVFTACVNKKTGLTRIISGKMKCYKSERQVTWNQTGPTGSQGATGATGPSGISKTFNKNVGSVEIPYNSPRSVISATIPAGKYHFVISGEAVYFNNNVATLKERYLGCLLTTHSDSPTAFSVANQGKVIWPVAQNTNLFRTRFAPYEATTTTFGSHPYQANGTLELTSETTVYYQCQNSTLSGDNGSTGQESKFHFLNLTLVQTDTVTTLN